MTAPAAVDSEPTDGRCTAGDNTRRSLSRRLQNRHGRSHGMGHIAQQAARLLDQAHQNREPETPSID